MRSGIAVLIVACLFTAGCGTPFSDGSGYEWGHTPAGSFDSDPFNLAAFGSPLIDGNGILYTLRAGSIDPDHIYGWARKTKAYYDALYACLLDNCTEFSEGYFRVSLQYPASWTVQSPEEKQQAAREMALAGAQYLAFSDGVWHEIATWYGHRTFPLISDFQSALSWEDLYSDRLGTWVGAQAIEAPGDFNGNVSRITAHELKLRDLVDTDRARRITRTMENVAYEEDPFAKKMLWRSLDIGTGDNQINPVVFPGFTEQPPISLPAPTLAPLDQRQVRANIIVKPSSPKYSTIHSKANLTGPIEPAADYPKILAVIKQDALEQGFRVFD